MGSARIRVADPRETSVVIPAFNEAGGIEATVSGLRPHGFAEIVGVDDGDAQALRLEELTADYNKILGRIDTISGTVQTGLKTLAAGGQQ